MTKLATLMEKLRTKSQELITSLVFANDEITVECSRESILALLLQLRDEKGYCFDQLIDLCAVDYLQYGQYDWETTAASENGFSRAVEKQSESTGTLDEPRFAVVYHLLSTVYNHRLRIKVYLAESDLMIPSVHHIWAVADWYEREAYDLYGVLFENHPDLRRILTDYGFIGHPFRKDFPVSGHVEMRYDASLQKVIYEPVSIEPRILTPKVIREDNRHIANEGSDV